MSQLRPLGPKNQLPEFKGTAVVDGDFKVRSCIEDFSCYRLSHPLITKENGWYSFSIHWILPLCVLRKSLHSVIVSRSSKL